MVSLFLVLLFLTTLVSLFLYFRTNHDIHLVLGVSSGIIFILWSLIVSHWSIHLLGLLALICLRIPALNPQPAEICEE